jgi:hypothetical protein
MKSATRSFQPLSLMLISFTHVGMSPMLRLGALLILLLLPPPLFEPKNAPLLELPLLVRLPDPRFFLTPPALDLSFQLFAPLDPPFRLPRAPRKLAEPLLGCRAADLWEAARWDVALGKAWI